MTADSFCAHGTATQPTEGGSVKYYIQHDVGKARYVVNYCDGRKRHKDGSDFYDIKIFGNKRALSIFVASLRLAGYVEQHHTNGEGKA